MRSARRAGAGPKRSFSKNAPRGRRPSSQRAARRRPLSSQLDRLDLEELVETERPQLAAVAGLLVATKRSERVERRAVDLDLARPQPARELLRVLGVV